MPKPERRLSGEFTYRSIEMNQLFSDDVALVSGGSDLADLASWLYDHQEDVGRFFDAAFKAYDETRQAHKKTN
jgi:hypothetical protein